MKNRKIFFVFNVRYRFSFVLLQLYFFLLSSTHFLVLKTFEVKIIQALLLGLK